jgi:hypothetical protein
MQECISQFCMLPQWLCKKVCFYFCFEVSALLFPSIEGEVFFLHLLGQEECFV